MLVIFLAACTLGGDDAFFSSSGRYNPPKWGDTGSGDTSGDSADTADVGGDDGAPEFTDVAAEWSDYPNVGIVLQVTASYTDENDDIEGGNCYIDAFVDGENVGTFDSSVAADTDGDAGCIASGGSFLFALQGLDESKTTTAEFSVKDSSGNLSLTYSAEAAGE